LQRKAWELGQFQQLLTNLTPLYFCSIGGGNYTYTALMDMGFTPDQVPIIASEGTKAYLEELIEAGSYSYRAPLPTETFDGKEYYYTLGRSTVFSMETVNAHQHGDRDVVIFLKALDDQPAIMMMIDVV